MHMRGPRCGKQLVQIRIGDARANLEAHVFHARPANVPDLSGVRSSAAAASWAATAHKTSLSGPSNPLRVGQPQSGAR
jgi:hypothetical protein